MSQPFGTRLAHAMAHHGPLCLGIDPHPQLLQDWGLEDTPAGLASFSKTVVEVAAETIGVAALKPQVALYERFGSAGFAVLEETLQLARQAEILTIADAKRGDIGSTSEAYAVGHLGKVAVGSKSYYPFDEDFVTVNPYLGSDGVNPFVKICKEENKGLFILVKTSNPSSGEFQDRLIDGRPLYEYVGEKVAEWGADCMDGDYSNIGAVVGATYPEMGKVLRKIMKKRPNKTCIVTTHRPSVLNMCARVYRVMDTKLTELSEEESSRMAMDF